MDRTPFVGRNFNSTRAGIHADGLIKNEEIYNIFNTEKILGRPVNVMVGEVSGSAGIAHWMNTHFGLKDDEKIDKHDGLVLKIKDEIDKEYANGRTTSFGDMELEQIIRELDPERFFALTHIIPGE